MGRPDQAQWAVSRDVSTAVNASTVIPVVGEWLGLGAWAP